MGNWSSEFDRLLTSSVKLNEESINHYIEVLKKSEMVKYTDENIVKDHQLLINLTDRTLEVVEQALIEIHGHEIKPLIKKIQEEVMNALLERIEDIMKFRLKLEDGAVKLEGNTLVEWQDRWDYISEQAHRDVTQYHKEPIDIMKDVIIPVYDVTGVRLDKRYSLTPHKGRFSRFEEVIVFGLGKLKGYNHVYWLRPHHVFIKGAVMGEGAVMDPETKVWEVPRGPLFGSKDTEYVWFYNRSWLDQLVEKLIKAVESGLI